MVGTIAAMMGNTTKTDAEVHSDLVKQGIYTAEANVSRMATAAQMQAGGINESQQLGSVRGAYGASGVTMTGTAADTMNSQAGILDAKIKQDALAGSLKTNVLTAESNAEGAAASAAQSEGEANGVALAFGGFLKGAAAGAG